jgi:hypothetical protein
MPTNYKRRYSYEAMVPERAAAMRRLMQHPERIGVDGLQAAEDRLAKAKLAMRRYFPPLRDGPRGAHMLQIRKERRGLEAEVFYATVERDAYKIVLKQIEPDTPAVIAPPKRYRSPNGLRPAEVTALLAKMRYRRSGYARQMQELEYRLAYAIEHRAEARTKVDQCAANTLLLRTQHTRVLSARRLTLGPSARTPKGMNEGIEASVQAWKESYKVWQRAQAEVIGLRTAVERKRNVVESIERRIAELLG